MDFVARAKALLADKARLGLLILPLAAAVPAAAVPVVTLPTGNFSCSQNDGGAITDCTGSSSVQQLGVVNGIQGLKFFGPSGGYTFTSSNTSGGESVSFSTQGLLGGGISAGTLIPVSYNFNLTGSGCCGAAITGWLLNFTIFQAGGSASASFSSPGSNFTGQQSGGGNMVVSSDLSGGVTTTVASILQIFYTNFDGFTATLVIPSSSLDINPDAAAVPEPANAALLGVGIALLGGYRLIRRRKGYVVMKDSSKG